MCGIAGFIGKDHRLTEDMLLRMRETLVHRGPDDAGSFFRVYNTADGAPSRVGLAHRRLSIIDLSEQGHQPMANEDRSIWITYNGEFYNYRDYRATLEQKGHRFASRTDTETILHLYEERGLEQALDGMIGMYAFALWDERNRKLFLARDRMGQKPLYYAELPEGVLFASEIKALLASGLIDEEELDFPALDQFWQLGYIMAPHTVYSGIRQLPQAFYSVISDGGRVEDGRRYWRVEYDYVNHPYADVDAAVRDLEERMASSVEQRLISDVPLGLFLSGGIDSTLLASIASRVLGRKPDAYTIGFPGSTGDETKQAEAIAQALGLSHTVMSAHHDMPENTEDIVNHFDEPFGDMSCIPTYQVSALARKHVTVALSGDAGDELFGGYEHYRQGLTIWNTRCGSDASGSPLSSVLRPPSSVLRPLVAQRRSSEVRDRCDRDEGGLPLLSALYYRMLGPVKGFVRKERLINDRLRRCLYGRVLGKTSARAARHQREQWAEEAGPRHPLDVMQTIDRHTYLPYDVLTKVDRMSMAVSLECRSPLLDHRVVECAMRLPPTWRVSPAGESKWVLKQLMERYLPRNIWDRPKQGFTPPWEQWCGAGRRNELWHEWKEVCAPWFQPEAAEILFPEECSPEKAPLMWAAYSMLRFLEGQK